MTRRIGNTTYKVKVFLSEDATETFQDKVLWLVRHDSLLSCNERTDDETKEN
ncbi:MAG: transposon-encoded TnpW family protein [Oscillospiraceae bacterium]|nr:transposon-encoded TnpW family protein [Oscillospiraceae bacterium]